MRTPLSKIKLQMTLGKRVFIDFYQKITKSSSVFRCLLLCICSSLPESPAIKNPALLIILSSLSGKTWLINWTNWPRRCITYHVKLVQKSVLYILILCRKRKHQTYHQKEVSYVIIHIALWGTSFLWHYHLDSIYV